MVGAAGRRDRAVREGRAGALPVAARRRTRSTPGSRRPSRAGSAASARRGSTAAARSCSRRSRASCPRSSSGPSAAAAPGCRSPRRAADTLLELRGARLDQRALRCAIRLQVGQEPAGATLSLVDSVGDPRFTLDVNWDPDTIPAFLALPACEAHGRSLPLDPYLIEPLEHYLRTYGVEVGGAAQEKLDRLRDRARRRDRRRPALARARRARRRRRGAPRRRAAALPARRRRLRAVVAADVPGRRAGPRQDGAGAGRARGRRRLARRRDLPRQPEAQLAARDRALAPAPLGRRRLRHGGGRARAPT